MQAALEASLQRLSLDHVDLLLIHWPDPKQDEYVETWRAMAEARERGEIRSIGVSNFTEDHLERLVGETGIVPVINQIELHPFSQQTRLHEVHARMGICTQAWSPLGQSEALKAPAIAAIAARVGKTPAQIVLRWHFELGIIVIPKSVTPERIRSNLEVFDFSLEPSDHEAIAKLDSARRLGPDPLLFP
jgi:2,5-diketo-D-gluconate reductase A